MKVFLDSIGCRLNQSEVERYAHQFHSAGHEVVTDAENADLAIINTCAVTRAAASDSRQKIRQAARAGASEVVVTGCWSTLDPRSAAALPAVSEVVPNVVKDDLVLKVLNKHTETGQVDALQPVPLAMPRENMRTRAFIKVQDGCENHCTFCVTTIARGTGRSRSEIEVVEEIQAVVEAGAQEIVLTGVHLGSWGYDFATPAHLHQLVTAILERTDTPRLRLSSLEPWDLDGDFFHLWESWGSRLCRHLHLPLQSGSAGTLRRMARKTTPAAFRSLAGAARKVIPGLALTTDIIVGFPGETDAEFEESLTFVEEMAFAGGHVFTYSPRPGTAAARMPNQVPKMVAQERSRAMRAVLEDSAAVFRRFFVGEEVEVLWENNAVPDPQSSSEFAGWQVSGLTDNYLRVQASASRRLWNTITPVRVEDVMDSNGGEVLRGRIITP